MTGRLLGAALALTAGLAAAADDGAFHGSLSRTPAQRWEDGFVSGNGRLGAVLFGDPRHTTLAANHCRLFLPLGNRELVPDLARFVPEMRRIFVAKGYQAAMDFFLGKAKEQGYPGLVWTDPYHPGLFVNLSYEPAGAITGFERSEDFATGEVVEHWRDDRGEYRRRMFVSRVDNLIALRATGPAAVTLEFPGVGHKLIHGDQQTGDEWVTYHNTYVKGKGGYDAVVRIVRRDEGRDVLLLIRIVPWKTPLPQDQSEAWAYRPDNPDFKHRSAYRPAPPLADSSVVAYRRDEDATALLPQVKAALAAVKPDYDALLAPHAAAHAALFNRVKVDLGGGAERSLSTEDLLAAAGKEQRLPAALAEKMYDAGRYMLICCAGELLPNLQGIWTGSWDPAWSGDFTLDTNVQAALACACSANLGDLLEGYFRVIEGFYPEWRINAQRLYGCRGYLSNTRASNTCLMLHWGSWEGVFWTAGAGWLASFFADYADYSGDRAFLARRCVPLLKEIVAFYEDFLSETDAGGHVVFNPSMNPETGCRLNATMDTAVAREMLMRLIAACRQLGIEANSVPRWEALLAKLPPYTVNAQGALPEFAGGGIDAGHRHHSQLYGCYQSFDPLFETDPALRAAARQTVKLKIAGSDGGGEQSSFGRVQSGVSAAYLGLAEEAYGRVRVMAVKRSMNPSLITSHEPNGDIFNTDGNGGIPQIINTMLVFSRPGRVDLLPALPAAWPSGSAKGLRARGGLTVDLTWRDGKVTDFRLTAARRQAVSVRVNGETRTVKVEGSGR